MKRDKYSDIDWHINVRTKEIFVAQLLFVKFGNSQMTLSLCQNNCTIQAEKSMSPCIFISLGIYLYIAKNVGKILTEP